jgi:hypothetical protein
VATSVLQATVPDELRASVLGLGDTVMVGAALLAAVATPWLGVRLGPASLLLLVAAGTAMLALAWSAGRQGPDSVATLPGGSGEELPVQHEDVGVRVPGV